MIEVKLDESDRLDWALKTFKKKVLKSGILKDLRRKRHYVKPSEARQLKMAAARRRGRSGRQSRYAHVEGRANSGGGAACPRKNR